MRKWIVLVLALVCVMLMLYTGIDALSNQQNRLGLFLTFVGSMTVIGLGIDFFNHIKSTWRSM